MSRGKRAFIHGLYISLSDQAPITFLHCPPLSQTFLLKTKRLIAYNKPRPLAPPPHESDWCTHCWCILCLPTFNFCVCWYCLIIKLNVFSPRCWAIVWIHLTSSSHSIHPITHMLCVCVCVCLFLCPSNLYENNAFDLIWLLLLTNPYSSKTICQFSIMMTIAFSLVQRSGIGSHHTYCDKISCFQLINRVCFDLSS